MQQWCFSADETSASSHLHLLTALFYFYELQGKHLHFCIRQSPAQLSADLIFIFTQLYCMNSKVSTCSFAYVSCLQLKSLIHLIFTFSQVHFIFMIPKVRTYFLHTSVLCCSSLCFVISSSYTSIFFSHDLQGQVSAFFFRIPLTALFYFHEHQH